MLLINDVHIGTQRKAGTTPASQEALRSYLFSSIHELLESTGETHVCVLGDLFDQFEIAPRDWLDTYTLFAEWLNQLDTHRLTLIAGNHDHSPKADRVSSFEMLCRVLAATYQDRVQVVPINDWAIVDSDVVAIAHCANQEVFDLKLDEILEQYENCTLLVHCNFDNSFAVEQDHSLNMSRPRCKQFVDKGIRVVFAHVHQACTAFESKVFVLGNQWPTSVADCLGNNKKFAHILTGGRIEKVQTWSVTDASAPFRTVDWTAIADVDVAVPGFIRVTGDVGRNQAAEAVNAIAKLRTKSQAFVITNSVKVEGMVETEELPKSFEAAKRFDVMEFIAQHLDEKELAVVKKLAEEKQ